MKNNWKIIACLLKQPTFKFLIATTLVFSIYSALIYAGPIPHVLEACLTPFITSWSTVFLMLIITFVSFYTTSYLKNLTILKIRFKNQFQEFETLSIYMVLSTLVFILIYLIAIITIVILTHGFSIGNALYNIKNIGLYLPFYLIRYVIIITIYGLLIGIISYKLPKVFALIIGSITTLSLLFYTQSPFTIINNIWNLKLYFGNYLSIVQYSDFFTEVACSSLYIILLSLLYCLLKKIILSMTKSKGLVQLELVKRDILSLKIYKKKLLLSLFLVFLLAIITKLLLKLPIDTTFYQEILGLNFINSSNIIVLASTLFYFVFFIYLAIYLLSQDLLYQTEHYFLRMNVKDWYSKKLINILIITSAIKLIMYLIATIIFYIANHSLLPNIGILLMMDIIFTTLLQSLIFLIYIAKGNHKVLSIILLVITIWITRLTITKGTIYHNISIIAITAVILCYIYKICTKQKSWILEKKKK